MKYSLSSQSYALNRRSKEGDWICLKCANYNYSFRQLCNRCQQQQRELNEHWLNLLGIVHYGELSFPSALFLNSENNLYYQNHQESQENPENSQSLPITSPAASICPHPSRSLTACNALPERSKGSKLRGECLGEQGLSCGKWINQLLD